MNQQHFSSHNATPHWHAQLPDGRVIGPITSDELELWLSQNALPSGAIIVNDEGSLHPSCIAMTADDCAANSGRPTANHQPPPLPPRPPSELDMMRQAIGRSRRNPRKKVPVIEGWIRLLTSPAEIAAVAGGFVASVAFLGIAGAVIAVLKLRFPFMGPILGLGSFVTFKAVRAEILKQIRKAPVRGER